MFPSYVIISPCRNEEKFMRQTLDSVVGQTFLPSKWIVVDDGSTDQTPFILKEYAARFDWIEVVTRGNRGHRAVGPGVIDAFYAGYSAIEPSKYEYFCKLDLDLRLPPKYFEILSDRMGKNPRIGTCSGKAYIERDGNLVYERHGDETSIGATKFFRISCFEEIGGFVREVNWDGIDCHQCRMNGWIACSWDEPDLRFMHLRPMGSSQKGIFYGRMRSGYGQYYMGTGIIYMLAVAINRMTEKPYVLGGCMMFWGWILSAIKRKPRYYNPEFRKYLKRFQWQALLHGKARAVEKLYKDRGVDWPPAT